MARPLRPRRQGAPRRYRPYLEARPRRWSDLDLPPLPQTRLLQPRLRPPLLRRSTSKTSSGSTTATPPWMPPPLIAAGLDPQREAGRSRSSAKASLHQEADDRRRLVFSKSAHAKITELGGTRPEPPRVELRLPGGSQAQSSSPARRSEEATAAAPQRRRLPPPRPPPAAGAASNRQNQPLRDFSLARHASGRPGSEGPCLPRLSVVECRSDRFTVRP